MTTVAVTGGTGRIGAPLLRALVQSGRRVRALTRRARPEEPGIDWVVGDLHDQASITELVSGAETVFHAAGQMSGDAAEVERSLIDGTAAVLRAAKGTKVVHLSSLVVLQSASPFPGIIDEQSPREPTPERRGHYTRAKAAAEHLARDAAATQDVVIVRPGLVVDSTSPLPLAVGWRRGRWVLLVGPGSATLPVVFAEDVATGLMLAADRLSSGEVLHLVDPRPMSRGRLLELLQSQDEPLRPIDLGRWVLWLAAVASASRLPRISGAGYRMLSAAMPHKWSAAKAVGLGWKLTSHV